MNEIVRKLRDNRHKNLFESADVPEEFEEEELEESEEETEEAGRIAEEGEFEEFKESANVSPGLKFKNAGFEWEVLATKGDYALVYAKSKKLNPYTVAFRLDMSDGSWAQGHYYDSKEKAYSFLKSKPGILKESEGLINKKKCTCGGTDIVTEEGKDICNECGRVVADEVVEENQVDKKPAAIRKALEWWKAGHYQKAVELYKKYGVSDREFARALTGSINESEEGIDFEDSDLDEALELSVATPYVERDGEESVRIIINGDEYRYRSDKFSIADLIKKFSGIYKHSAGSALQWLKKNSYVYYNGRTKKFAENKNIVYKDKLKEGEDTPLEKNIIRSIHTPMSTANKPGFDASISEANDAERYYTERELIAYLRSSKESPIYIRTSRVKAGWDDVQFAAQKAGYEVSKVYDKTLLKNLNLPGNFAEFYVFRKR